MLTSSVIAECLTAGVMAAGLPDASIQLVPTTDRIAVGEMLKMSDCIDVIVPRGGRSLIERIAAESRVPLFKHLDGICHTYVHAAADPEMARRIVFNAKMRRPGICGATETLLVDREVAPTLLPPILDDLLAAGCEVRGDAAARVIDSRVVPATDADWDTEYLDKILAVKIVDGVQDAIAHIREHSSQHTEAIVTEDRRRRGNVRRRARQRDPDDQRLDPVRRRRRVRDGRRDRYRHRQAACARPGRRRATHQLQVRRPGFRPMPAMKVTSTAPMPAGCFRRRCAAGFTRAMNGARV